jgi:hypothetical protein
MKTYRGARDAHVEERWIFIDENAYPYRVRGEYTGNTYMTYYPEQNVLTTEETEGGVQRRFHIVTAEIKKEETTEDVTEIFHRIKWSPGAAPSVLEMILLHNMHKQTMYSIKDIRKWKLHVMDDNADEHVLDLGKEGVFVKFRGWAEYNETMR